jgi:hypothetical protein
MGVKNLQVTAVISPIFCHVNMALHKRISYNIHIYISYGFTNYTVDVLVQLHNYDVMECIIFILALWCWVKNRGTLVGRQKHLLLTSVHYCSVECYMLCSEPCTFPYGKTRSQWDRERRHLSSEKVGSLMTDIDINDQSIRQTSVVA